MTIVHNGPAPGDSATELGGAEHQLSDCGPADNPTVAEPLSSSVLDEIPRPSTSRTRDEQLDLSARSPHGRHQLLLILLASYASAVTLALLYVLASGALGRSHELEHLPDIEPLDKSEFRYVPPEAALPPGHRLKLGQQRRYGHILVEPLRVTRGRVEFVHFSGQTDQPAPESLRALKLWVRFTNLSDDQRIAPLDRTLLFKRAYVDASDQVLANNVIVARSGGGADQSLLFMLEQPLTGEWNLKHQQLGVRLNPGESVETFLPSQVEGIDDLYGELLWRIHFRKGYHARTGHGVTGLVEVAFTADDIEVEDGAPTASGS